MNVMMLLEMAASGFGDRVAIGRRDGTGITYEDLFHTSTAASRLIAEKGVEHVGLIDVSSPAFPIALFGAAAAGKPFVPMNYRLTPSELQRLAGQIAPGLVIVNDDTAAALGEVNGLHSLERIAFLESLEPAQSSSAEWPMDPDAIAILLYTSGTTGAPKAAVLRHRHLVSYILGSVEFMGAHEDEATLVSVPPYHVAGVAALCSSIYSGRRIVQLPNFDADTWIDLARDETITHAMVVPTMLARIVDRLAARGESLPALRALSYGGGKMARPVIEEALRLLPETNFVNAYGLTETSSTVSILGPDDHRDAFGSNDIGVRNRLSSVGRPLPTLEISIRDDEGAEVAPGTTGEIWVRGEQVSGEYLGRDSRVTADGWLPTNDGGLVDADGFLFVDGRLDDVIVRGGENISPGEIEDTLLTHPSIRDAAAIGLPDDQWGEVIAVAVVFHDGVTLEVAEIQAHVLGLMRSSRVPDHVAVLDELPYNETGKLLRRVLREQLAELGSASE